MPPAITRSRKKAHEERLKDTDVGAFRYGLKKLGEVEALHADSKR